MEIDEPETFQQQALEIRLPDENFDPSRQPQNGEEYLMHMLYERKQCPAVVVKKTPQKTRANMKTNNNLKQQGQVEQVPIKNILTDVNLLPTNEWKLQQMNTFLRTRSKIIMLRQHQTPPKNHCCPILNDDDESTWLKFCMENTPKLNVIMEFNQRTLEQLITMLSVWLETETTSLNNIPNQLPTSSSTSLLTSKITATQDNGGEIGELSSSPSPIIDLANSEHWLGSWLYAVLTCLHLPLEPAVHSTLRDIARTCMRLRSKLESQELTKAIPYNLFIYLIGKVFDQYDLLEYV